METKKRGRPAKPTIEFSEEAGKEVAALLSNALDREFEAENDRWAEYRTDHADIMQRLGIIENMTNNNSRRLQDLSVDTILKSSDDNNKKPLIDPEHSMLVREVLLLKALFRSEFMNHCTYIDTSIQSLDKPLKDILFVGYSIIVIGIATVALTAFMVYQFLILI